MTIEEYRAAILQALLDTKNEDGTPAITPREAQEALNGFTDDELQDGLLWNSPEDVASIILDTQCGSRKPHCHGITGGYCRFHQSRRMVHVWRTSRHCRTSSYR